MDDIIIEYRKPGMRSTIKLPVRSVFDKRGGTELRAIVRDPVARALVERLAGEHWTRKFWGA